MLVSSRPYVRTEAKQNSYCIKNKRTRLLKTDSCLKVCKEYKVTGLGKPVEFLVIILYAKESIRLMKSKQNPYLDIEKSTIYVLLDKKDRFL